MGCINGSQVTLVNQSNLYISRGEAIFRALLITLNKNSELINMRNMKKKHNVFVVFFFFVRVTKTGSHLVIMYLKCEFRFFPMLKPWKSRLKSSVMV